MIYEPKNFDSLLGTPGFSDILLKNHLTLYQGYVSNVNKLVEILNSLIKEGKAGGPEYNEIKRRFGWEWNGMRLHEFYFGNMAKAGASLDQNSKIFQKISADFQSFADWEKDFKTASSIRGIGWVILYYDHEADKFFNTWVTEHDAGHLAGCRPLLVIDVFEHAYVLDYGLKRADYIEAFMKAADWKVVEKRFS